MNKKLMLIIVGGIFIAVIAVTAIYVSMNKSGLDNLSNDIQENLKTEIMTDLIKKGKFSPPYEDFTPLVKLAESCKTNFFNKYPLEAEYMRIIIKQELLGIATSNIRTRLGGLIEKSGGTVALSDYITPDLIYIYNIKNRSSKSSIESANKIYAEFNKSSQVIKASKFMSDFHEILIDEDIDNDKKLLSSVGFLCLQNDIFYTALGGVEYSNSADIYPSVKRALHNGTMSSLGSSLDNLMNSN